MNIPKAGQRLLHRFDGGIERLRSLALARLGTLPREGLARRSLSRLRALAGPSLLVSLLQQENDAAHAAQLRLAHARSEQAQLDFASFQSELAKCLAGKGSLIDFDEGYYLQANPEVADQVRRGRLHSGYVHYCLTGRSEGLMSSTRVLRQKLGIAPHCPEDDLTRPVHFNPPKKYGPDLSGLPSGTGAHLVILVPFLRRELFFAGYASFFKDISVLFPRFAHITVIVLMDGIDAALVKQFDERIQILPYPSASLLKQRPDLIFCFDYETFFMAQELFNDLPRTVYYCQDFEAGFYPYGVRFVRAETAVLRSQNLVISTGLLRDYLAQRKLLEATNVLLTSPRIEAYEVAARKQRRLFFYFRPEAFNTRNLPELIMDAVHRFTAKYTGYEIYLVGTVGTSYSRRVNGTDVFVVSKLPTAQYKELLTSCDVMVSLIYSAHPGVIAFQAAASGIPTVTNVFDNRDAALLQRISENIVPYDPVRDDLVERIERALAMEKGRPAFASRLYAGEETRSLESFIDTVLRGAQS